MIVSGGQTGVDRAALDEALAQGFRVGGWCPAGCRAEDGPIHPRYGLRPTPSADPAQRTAWNVRDSDATLVLVRGPVRGGTLLTVGVAERFRKPVRVVDLDPESEADAARGWLAWTVPRVLNVAGPRESEAPGVYRLTRGFLRRVWSPGGPGEVG